MYATVMEDAKRMMCVNVMTIGMVLGVRMKDLLDYVIFHGITQECVVDLEHAK